MTTRSQTAARQRSASHHTSARSEKWVRRREEIVDISAKVFAANGFHATSTTELCEATGLGKGALYYYISSKEALLAAIHDRVMDEVLDSAGAVVQRDATPSQHLELLGRELLTIIARYPDHVWVFLHEFPALTGENATQFRARRHAYERVVEDVISAGVAAGEFRNVDAKLTSRAWLGMHNYTYLWLKPGGTFDADDVADRFADLFLGGLST